MKKILFLLPLILLCGCMFNKPENINNSSISTGQEINNENVDFDIDELSQSVLKALSDDDMDKFSTFVDPEKGVRFTPYGYVTDDDIVLVSAELLGSRDKMFVWGIYDGIGDPIEMTIKDYLKNFVYDKDFLQAPIVVNGNIVARGNSLVNVNEYYKDADIIEYHFPSFNPEYAGMDRESLILVFETHTHSLIGVIHEQYTV